MLRNLHGLCPGASRTSRNRRTQAVLAFKGSSQHSTVEPSCRRELCTQSHEALAEIGESSLALNLQHLPSTYCLSKNRSILAWLGLCDDLLNGNAHISCTSHHRSSLFFSVSAGEKWERSPLLSRGQELIENLGTRLADPVGMPFVIRSTGHIAISVCLLCCEWPSGAGQGSGAAALLLLVPTLGPRLQRQHRRSGCCCRRRLLC